jgi:Arc/MetJ family transcription regulator
MTKWGSDYFETGFDDCAIHTILLYWVYKGRREIMSRTNIDIDDKLVKEGLQITRLRTKKELVNHALEELVKKARRKRILKLEGKVWWEGDLRRTRTSRG